MLYRPDLDRILPLLVCPVTGERLVRDGENLIAEAAGRRYAILEGVPILMDGAGPIERRRDADSHPLAPELHERFERLDGWGLNIGAGGTETSFPNCIELETAIWRHTDVVGDAHRLPFATGSFSLVVALNTFEHLVEPSRAAAEIFRVLEPGGELYLLTAFLQPLHEAPHHYYNCTEFGLREWFSAFDVHECSVSGNFNPILGLGWIANDIYLDIAEVLGTDEAELFANARCGDIRRFWSEPSTRKGPLWDAFYRLPQDRQKKYAAGFELRASKPEALAESNASPRPPGLPGYASSGHAREELMAAPASKLIGALVAKARRWLFGRSRRRDTFEKS